MTYLNHFSLWLRYQFAKTLTSNDSSRSKLIQLVIDNWKNSSWQHSKIKMGNHFSTSMSSMKAWRSSFKNKKTFSKQPKCLQVILLLSLTQMVSLNNIYKMESLFKSMNQLRKNMKLFKMNWNWLTNWLIILKEI